jgi:hypothetical protein
VVVSSHAIDGVREVDGGVEQQPGMLDVAFVARILGEVTGSRARRPLE